MSQPFDRSNSPIGESSAAVTTAAEKDFDDWLHDEEPVRGRVAGIPELRSHKVLDGVEIVVDEFIRGLTTFDLAVNTIHIAYNIPLDDASSLFRQTFNAGAQSMGMQLSMADKVRSVPSVSEQVRVHKVQAAHEAKVQPESYFDHVLSFVPRYNHTQSLSWLFKLVDWKPLSLPDIETVLVARGYPRFWAHKLHSMCSVSSGRVNRARELELKASRRAARDDFVSVEEFKSRSAKAVATLNLPKALAQVQPVYWRIPTVRQLTPVRRPTARNFSHSEFKAWIHYCATLVRETFKSKLMFVTSSDIALGLYKSGRFTGSRKELDNILSRIRVYAARYENRDFEEPTYQGPHRGYITMIRKDQATEIVRRLFIGDHAIDSIDVLNEWQGAFHAHKPLFRSACAFFAGSLNKSQETQLQQAIWKNIRTQHQGATLSTPVPVSHSFNVPASLPTITIRHELPVLQQLVQLFEDSGVEGVGQRVTQVLAFLTSLWQSTSYLGAISATIQFVSGIPYLWKCLTDLLKFVGQPFMIRQGSLEAKSLAEASEWPGFSVFFSATVSGIISTLLGEASATISSLHPALMELVGHMRYSLIREGCTTISKAFLDALQEAVTRLTQCIKQRTFAPLWGERWDPRRWSKNVEVFMTHYPNLTCTGVELSNSDIMATLRREGSLPLWFTAPLSLPDFIDRCEEYHSTGKVLVTQFKSAPALSRELSSILHRFRLFIDGLVAQQATGNQRMCPFSLMLWGPPGTGKTNLAQMMAQALGRLEGYDTSNASSYLWQEGVNFQDGLNHTHWHIHMDDIDQTTAKDMPGQRNFAQHFLALVNNAPMPVEMADVSMKGKIRANPRLITYCTNFEHCNLQTHLKEPVAFWRRVHMRVRVLAKPEFSKGNGVLDPEKAELADTYDLYELYVSFFDPMLVNDKNRASIPFTSERLVSFQELMELFIERYRSHMIVQKKLLSSKAIGGGGSCTFCGLPIVPGGKMCSHARDTLAELHHQMRVPEFVKSLAITVTAPPVLWAVDHSLRWILPRFTDAGDTTTYRLLHACAIDRLTTITSVADVLCLGAFLRRVRRVPQQDWECMSVFETLDLLTRTVQQCVELVGETMISSVHAEMLAWCVVVAERYSDLVQISLFRDRDAPHFPITAYVRHYYRRYLDDPSRIGWILLYREFISRLTPAVTEDPQHALWQAGTIIFPMDPRYYPVIAQDFARARKLLEEEISWLGLGLPLQLGHPGFPLQLEHQGLITSKLYINMQQLSVEDLVAQYERDFFSSGHIFAKTVGVMLVGVGLLSVYKAGVGVPQGRDANASDGLAPKGWFRADQNFKPGLPPPSLGATFTFEDILSTVAHCVVKVYLGEAHVGHAMVLTQNTVLCPMHYFGYPNIEYGKMAVFEVGGVRLPVQITPLNTIMDPAHRELCVIRVGGLKGVPGILAKMWSHDSLDIQSMDEVVVVHTHILGRTERNSRSVAAQGQSWKLQEVATQDGDCGAVYIGRHGSQWKIFGMHYSILRGIPSSYAIGAVITQFSLKAAVESLGAVHQGVSTAASMISKRPADLTFHPYPLKSEVWAAQSAGAERVYGMGEVYPPPAGSSLKTNVEYSLIRDEFLDWEELYCGQCGYWSLPKFKGHMEGDFWISPFTNAFTAENRSTPDFATMWLAVADYLSGSEDLSRDGWRPLSEEESIVGIPGSYIHSVNLKTSVGPPFNQGKRHHMVITPDKEAFVSPEVCAMFDELCSLLAECIPAAVGLCTLKDEPLKVGKMPRVFTNLPAAYNLLLKQQLSPIKSFMRAHRSFFESWVGVDLTSVEASSVVEQLQRVDPTLTRLYDQDARMLDKSYNGDIWDFIASVYYGVAWVLGHPDPSCVERLLLGLKHTRYIIKGDLFSVAWNPSGHDATVEVNGVCVSLGERYTYYRGTPVPLELLQHYAANFHVNPIPGPELRSFLNFRDRVGLCTYGDDMVKALRADYELPPNYIKLWREEFGIFVTDADKTDTLKKKTIFEIQFLKRRFVWSDKYQRWLTPLDMKSLVRTLVMKKESVLTSRDHACVAMTEVSRELVYHGEERYDDFLRRCEAVVEKYGLKGNGYLRLEPYSHWENQLVEGSFASWQPRDPQEAEKLSGTISFQMSNPQIVQAANDAAGNAEQRAPITETEHAVGAVSSDSTLVKAAARFVPKFFQRVQETPIADFLSRLTEIRTITVEDTDIFGEIDMFDPWELFLANSAVADKIKNFTLIRGTIEVVAVSAMPPSCYGAYCISGLPDGGAISTTLDSARSLVSENCMQVDHYTMIDCAASDNAVIQLPFLWQYDFAELPVGPKGSWQIYTTCLTPIRSGLAEGLTTGTIRFFARLLPGYELTIPHFQGRRGGALEHTATVAKYIKEAHESKVVSKTANMVGDVADKFRGIPIVGEAATAVSWAAHGVATVASWFGFTRTSDERHPLPVMHRSVTNVAHFDGSDSAEMAAFTMANAISIDPALVGGPQEDVASFTSLFSRWTLTSIFTWSPGAEANSIIGYFPVTPMFCRRSGLDGTLIPTVAGYVGLPFSFWRGDMEYLIYVPVSKFHRGSLQVVWAPKGSSPTSSGVTNTALNYILDISAENQHEFLVGYARERPFINCRYMTSLDSIQYPDYANGNVFIRVINPLVSQSDVSSVDILVFSRAGSNMEFAVPAASISAQSTNTGTGLMTTVFHKILTLQGALGDDGVEESQSHTLVTSSGDYPSDALLFGERFSSVRALMQKPCRIYFEDEALPTGNQAGKYFCPIMGPAAWVAPGDHTTSSYQQQMTFVGLYRQLFTGVAASERFKFFPRSAMWIGAAPVYNNPSNVPVSSADADTLPCETQTLSPMTYSEPQRGVEVNIPYYETEKFLFGRRSYNPADSRRYTMITAITTPPAAIRECLTYHCFGPDIRLTCFRQVPVIRIVDATGGLGFPGPLWFQKDTAT